MNRFLMILATSALLASTAFAAGHRPEGAPDRAMLEILTPEQKAKLDTARDTYQKAREDVMASLTPEQKTKLDAAHKPMRERMEKHRAAMDSVLTPDQKADLDKARGGKTPDQMTKAEREAFRTTTKKVMESLTPEQKDKMRDLRKEGRHHG
jgi:Spy/CpxP family protein refolding chaperone